MSRRLRILIPIVIWVSVVGCVDRRYVVRTYDARDPRIPVPAQVTVDGVQLGPAPLDARYTYPGWYEFRAVAEGFQPLVQRVKLKPRWYDYPGLDLVAEVIWPFRIEDVREVNLVLQRARPLRPDELQAEADNLRNRGMALPPSRIPEPLPKNPPANPIQPGGGNLPLPPKTIPDSIPREMNGVVPRSREGLPGETAPVPRGTDLPPG